MICMQELLYIRVDFLTAKLLWSQQLHFEAFFIHMQITTIKQCGVCYNPCCFCFTWNYLVPLLFWIEAVHCGFEFISCSLHYCSVETALLLFQGLSQICKLRIINLARLPCVLIHSFLPRTYCCCYGFCCQHMILAESSEPQPSNIPALGEYDDRRQQLEKERNIEYNQHLAAVCDITL